MITITEKSIKFDNPVVIDGNSYPEFEWNKAKLIPAMDIAIAERFAKEQLFRQNGYVKVRLDGKPANKLEQGTDAYEDYVYADIAFPDYRFWPTERSIIDNSEEEICGSKTKVGLAISQIYNKEKFSAVQERVTKDVALRAKTIAEFGPVKTTLQPTQTQDTIKQEDSKHIEQPKVETVTTPVATAKAEKADFKAKKAKISPVLKTANKEEPSITITAEQPKPVEQSKAETTAAPVVTEQQQTPTTEPEDKKKSKFLIPQTRYQYFVQDRVNAEPFRSNPVLVQLAQKLETDSLKLNAYVDSAGLIWCPIFEGIQNEQGVLTFNFNEDKSFILDLNGVIINKDPKVFMMKAFRKYADECRFHRIEENTLEQVVKDGKLPTIAKERLEKMDYLIVLNKVVDLSSISRANIPASIIEKISKDITSDKRVAEIVECFNMNGNIRLRFKECSADGSRYVLAIDEHSQNSIIADPQGPTCPAVNYIFETGKDVHVEMQLPATA